MKMYVVRPHMTANDVWPSDAPVEGGRDEVISGRISPDFRAWQATQPEPTPLEIAPLWPQAPPTKPSPTPPGDQPIPPTPGTHLAPEQTTTIPAPGPSSPTTLYDGKTFDEWRSLWRNELKPERRTEAVRAMAAFARVGRAQEACEAILDVAGEYDFGKWENDTPTGELMTQIADFLRKGDSMAIGIPAEVVWPALLVRYKRDPDKYARLLATVLWQIKPSASFLSGLIELSKSENSFVQERATKRLLQTYPDDPQVQAAMRAEFQSGDAKRLSLAISLLRDSGRSWIPEADPALTADDFGVQVAARRLAGTLNEEKGRVLVERLTEQLAKAEDLDEKIALIRALAVLPRSSTDAAKEVVAKLADNSDPKIAIPAIVAATAMELKSMSPEAGDFLTVTAMRRAKAQGIELLATSETGRKMTNPDYALLKESIGKEVATIFGDK